MARGGAGAAPRGRLPVGALAGDLGAIRTEESLSMTNPAAVAVFVAALFLLPLRSAHPCVCYESEGLAADFGEAKAVVAGKIVALEIATVTVGGTSSEDMVATVRVERRWKGPKDALLRVRTCGTQETLCTCGTDFRVGGYFLIFAAGKPLATSSCQRTRSYSSVPDEAGAQWLGVEDLVRDLDALAHAGR